MHALVTFAGQVKLEDVKDDFRFYVRRSREAAGAKSYRSVNTWKVHADIPLL